MPTGTDRLPWEQLADLAARATDARRRAELYAADPARAGDAAAATRDAAEADAERGWLEDYLGAVGALLIDHATRPRGPAPPWGQGLRPMLSPEVQRRIRDGLNVTDLIEANVRLKGRVEHLTLECRWLRQRAEERDRALARLDARVKELEEGMSLWEESGLTPSDLRSGPSPTASGPSGPAAGTAAAATSTGHAASAGAATTGRASRPCTLRFRPSPHGVSAT